MTTQACLRGGGILSAIPARETGKSSRTEAELFARADPRLPANRIDQVVQPRGRLTSDVNGLGGSSPVHMSNRLLASPGSRHDLDGSVRGRTCAEIPGHGSLPGCRLETVCGDPRRDRPAHHRRREGGSSTVVDARGSHQPGVVGIAYHDEAKGSRRTPRLEHPEGAARRQDVAEWEGFELLGAPQGREHRHDLAGQPALGSAPRCPWGAQRVGEQGQVKADRGLGRPASFRSRSSHPPLQHFGTSCLRHPGAHGLEAVHGSPQPSLGVRLRARVGVYQRRTKRAPQSSPF